MSTMNEQEPYAVPSTAPVMLHRHGEGSRRRSIVVVLDEVDAADAEHVLAAWRRRIGNWVTQAEAATVLGVSVKRVTQLRHEGRLTWRRIGGVVAIDATSLAAEMQHREEGTGQ